MSPRADALGSGVAHRCNRVDRRVRAIDLFAGFGGFSLGAARAGVDIVWAANHWRLAVAVHQANHPTTTHVVQDLRQADWSALPDFDLLIASPACQGHSEAAQPARARGHQHDAERSTAWAVVDCADVTSPDAIIVENVVQLREWRLYPVWRAALAALGYDVTELVATASHHGAPQRRTRLFIVCTRTGRGEQVREALEAMASVDEVPFGPSIDWSATGWRPVSKASPGAQRRIARGRARHGDRFLTQHVTGHPGVSLEEPIRTITTKDQWAIVDGDCYRPLTIRETARGMGFPDSFALPERTPRADVIRGLGNAVPPTLAEHVVTAVMQVAA